VASVRKMPNRGEHSEVLALLRVLHAGKVQVADAAGQPRKSWLKVLCVRLPGSPDTKYVIGEKSISSSKEQVIRGDLMSRDEAGRLADALFEEIRAGEGASFDCPSSAIATEALQIVSSRASSAFKSDILLEVASPIFEGETLTLGFSIKSEIGSKPTLLNAGATHFEYQIRSDDDTDPIQVQESIPRAEGRQYPGPMKLLPALRRAGIRVVFERVVDPVFEMNLRMIDTSFPRMLADVLKHSYLEGEARLARLLDSESLRTELAAATGLPAPIAARVVRHKLKDLLRQSALGMNPASEWGGETEAHGGWLIVRESGELVCFHLVNDDEFREFLYSAYKIDTPSMTRHKAGYVYRQNDGISLLRLSLQIRLD
jgi:hypothetical protein